MATIAVRVDELGALAEGSVGAQSADFKSWPGGSYTQDGLERLLV
jgi:hypothetical protein